VGFGSEKNKLDLVGLRLDRLCPDEIVGLMEYIFMSNEITHRGQLIKYLEIIGLNLNGVDKNGETVLHHAARKGSKILNVLCSKVSDECKKSYSYDGKSALDVVVESYNDPSDIKAYADILIRHNAIKISNGNFVKLPSELQNKVKTSGNIKQIIAHPISLPESSNHFILMDRPQIDNLIFGADHLGLVACIGAINYLLNEQSHYKSWLDLQKITKFAGSSFGAIIASALAVGHDPEMLAELLSDFSLKKMLGAESNFYEELYKHFKSSKVVSEAISCILPENIRGGLLGRAINGMGKFVGPVDYFQ